ncbi:glycosyl transferase [Agaricicola taiwanensis]|uniref:Glycosyl transferase n=1 Tax=Agaricicola taiwanensis TaxID=591372 RepID=A0A8J2VPG0_9RHOB|nr:glycosyltransferase family 4 protein [Agaricicola taiwanensis]GGE37811.1 glycosyl transferase [Agaricicola taiwanensis]
MPDVAFAVPGDLNAPTGGYAYDRRIIAELTRLGWNVRLLALPGDFPEPSEASVAATLKTFADVPPAVPILVDGLAFGAMPAEALREAERTFTALVHHPLGLETGLTVERSRQLLVTEKAALTQAAAIIVTSRATAEILAADFGAASERITVAVPGVERSARAAGSSSGNPPRLLAVGSLIPRKGYDVLVEALRQTGDLPWTCRIAGAADRAPETANQITRQIEEAGLGGRITLVGALSDQEIADEYVSADIFVLASHFEGYGMVFTEALARGLPIVACAGGATAQTVPADAGILVGPGDATGFSLALRRLLTDPKERRRLADAAWAHASGLPTWQEAALRVSKVLETLS